MYANYTRMQYKANAIRIKFYYFDGVYLRPHFSNHYILSRNSFIRLLNKHELNPCNKQDFIFTKTAMFA